MILFNWKYKLVFFFVGNYKIEVENGYLFECDIFILCWVMLIVEDFVEICMGYRDEFDIFIWIMYYVFLFINNILLIIIIVYLYLIFIIMIYSIINLCFGCEIDI